MYTERLWSAGVRRGPVSGVGDWQFGATLGSPLHRKRAENIWTNIAEFPGGGEKRGHAAFENHFYVFVGGVVLCCVLFCEDREHRFSFRGDILAHLLESVSRLRCLHMARLVRLLLKNLLVSL